MSSNNRRLSTSDHRIYTPSVNSSDNEIIPSDQRLSRSNPNTTTSTSSTSTPTTSSTSNSGNIILRRHRVGRHWFFGADSDSSASRPSSRAGNLPSASANAHQQTSSSNSSNNSNSSSSSSSSSTNNLPRGTSRSSTPSRNRSHLHLSTVPQSTPLSSLISPSSPTSPHYSFTTARPQRPASTVRTSNFSDEPHKTKRRKLEMHYNIGHRYGKYGQVEPGTLQMEVVRSLGDLPSHNIDNILSLDSKQYSAENNHSNIVLQHRNGTPFSLQELVIRYPMTRSLRNLNCNGLVFLSMEKDEVFKRTTNYQIQYARHRSNRLMPHPGRYLLPEWRRGWASSNRRHPRIVLGQDGAVEMYVEDFSDDENGQEDDDNDDDDDDDEDGEYSHESDDEGCKFAQMPSEFTGSMGSQGVTIVCTGNEGHGQESDDSDENDDDDDYDDIDEYHSLRVVELDVIEDSDSMYRDHVHGSSRLRRSGQTRPRSPPNHIGTLPFEDDDGNASDSALHRAHSIGSVSEFVSILGSDYTVGAGGSGSGSGSQSGVTFGSTTGTGTGTGANAISLDAARQASQVATQNAVRAVGGSLMVPQAQFQLHETKCSITFDPPLTSRYILLKLWCPVEHSGHIVLQSVEARGFAGPQYYPSVELR